MTRTRTTPEEIIWEVLQGSAGMMTLTQRTDRIMRELTLNGYEVRDTLHPEPIRGEDITEGAGPDAFCGCGEPITMYDGVWLHIFNPELRGTDDHDADPS